MRCGSQRLGQVRSRERQGRIGSASFAMASRFGWIDFDSKQQRKMLDVIKLFRDHDTRDERGGGMAPRISDCHRLSSGQGAMSVFATTRQESAWSNPPGRFSRSASPPLLQYATAALTTSESRTGPKCCHAALPGEESTSSMFIAFLVGIVALRSAEPRREVRSLASCETLRPHPCFCRAAPVSCRQHSSHRG